MEVTFTNVTISIGGVASPEDAYDVLCAAIASLHAGGRTVEWETDRFTTNAAPEDNQSTTVLFPAHEDRRATTSDRTYAVTVTQLDGSTQSYDATNTTREAAHADAKAHYPDARLIDVAPVQARWSGHSAAFRAEHPWCGWTLAFAHGSDWDTTCFGLERLIGINVLLTTADGRSRPVNITKWQHIDPAYAAFGGANTACERKAGILAHELDTTDYEPLAGTLPTFVPYEDIREIVVY